VNREYITPEEKVATLTAEWEGLVGEAERIGADYRGRREELPRQQLRRDYWLLTADPHLLIS